MNKILISIISIISIAFSSITLEIGIIDTENNTTEILINSTSPIRGFQFDIQGLELSGGHGGLAEQNGFEIYAAGDTALGFNVDGNEIPATVSSQVLTILDGAINGNICLPFTQNIGPEDDTPIFADSNGDALQEIEIGDGSCQALNIDTPEISFNLFQAYPNPFNPQLNIDVSFLENENINISIYNLNGQIVETVFNGSMIANTLYTLNWDASDYSSGLYIVQVNGLYTKYSKIVNLLK